MASRTEGPPHPVAEMRSGFLPGRVVHLHPTRLCNMACLHCYSESSPQQKTALDPIVLCEALQILRAEGYQAVSLSGGEPLVYPDLRTVVERSRAMGFRVTMISNGLLVTDRAADLLSLLDGIAISFDGLAVSHNAMRGRADAFDRAASGLKRLADWGLPAAAAISLTREAIADLPDLADHLVSLGARALQIRPVAAAGRARALTGPAVYHATDYVRLYLVVLALQEELPSGIRVSCDLAPANGLWQQRDAYASLLGGGATTPSEGLPLADLVNPLVITEAGVVKPIAYDFDGRFDIASLNRLSPDNVADYKRHRLHQLQMLVGEALAGLRGRTDLVDWFDHCTRRSHVAWPLAEVGTTCDDLNSCGSNRQLHLPALESAVADSSQSRD